MPIVCVKVAPFLKANGSTVLCELDLDHEGSHRSNGYTWADYISKPNELFSKCVQCGCQFKSGDSTAFFNYQPICIPCHKLRVKDITKANMPVVTCDKYNSKLNLRCTRAYTHEGIHEANGRTWEDEEPKCNHYDNELNLFCYLIKGHEGLHEQVHANMNYTWPTNPEKGHILYRQPSEDNVMFGKVASTKIPRYELIPQSAMDALAAIFEKGIERKGEEHAWNALTQQQAEVLQDKMFVINRLAHVIGHAYSAIRKVMNGNEHVGEEDAGAIMFGGAVLAEYKERTKKP